VSRVLITGGCGNLGRLCAARFADAGDDVVLLDSVRPEDTPFPWSTDLPVHLVDLTDGPAVEALLDDVAPEVVVHLAAERVPSDHPDPDRACAPRFAPDGAAVAGGEWNPHRAAARRDATFRSNVLGTYYLLDALVRAGVRRLVAASSLCVLGAAFRISDRRFEIDTLPIDETHPLRPEDSYSVSKVANEEMYAAYARAYGLQVAAIRPPVVLYDTVPASWANRFHDEPAPPGPGGIDANLLMYVDGRDLAEAFLRASQAPGLDGFEAFYVATGRLAASSPKRWLQQHRPDLDHFTDALGDDDDLLRIDKARRLLGYVPRHRWHRDGDEVAPPPTAAATTSLPSDPAEPAEPRR
jgi:UDP-glucose 4-epimerase